METKPLPTYEAGSGKEPLGRHTWAREVSKPSGVIKFGGQYFNALELAEECKLRVGIAAFHCKPGDWIIWRRSQVLIIRKSEWGRDYLESA